MYLHGDFYNKAGQLIAVEVVTNGDKSTEVVIGENGIYFDADECVAISSTASNTFDVVLAKEASIKLLSDRFLPDLFVADIYQSAVTVTADGTTIFSGHLKPLAYSQDFQSVADTLELSCVDELGALAYSNYADIGSAGVTYAGIKATASMVTFADIIKAAIGTNVYYDGSKRLTSTGGAYTILAGIKVSELLFLDDDEDKVWSKEDAVTEILRYLNLHILQDGDTFHIFDWATVKSSDNIDWQNIFTGAALMTARQTTAISLDNVADDGTSLSLSEVYNVISLTCDISDVDALIENPLDEDTLTAPYRNKQLLLTEYISEGEGVTAIDAFYKMTHTGKGTSDYSEAKTVDWFLQSHGSSSWRFYKAGTSTDLIEDLCGDGKTQTALPDWLAGNIGAAIFSLGDVEHKFNATDNSLISKVSMTNYLAVSVNGNEDDTESGYRPNAADLLANAPIAEYIGTTSGGVLSPADNKTTNYLVISGKLFLAPIQKDTDAWAAVSADMSSTDFTSKYWHKTVPSRNNGDGRYYTRQWYDAATPYDTPTTRTAASLMPCSDECEQAYEFKYSAIGDGSDTISKVSVLACMLIVGDKVAVESGTDGQISDFDWQTYKTREECSSDDEYYAQCIFIGFNPKIGDKLIGTSFDLQNNISYTLGLDVEGIAIPIKQSDAVSGQVTFKILGPVNTLWDDITRRHPTWFRHTKWTTTTIPLLSHVSTIFIENLEIKVYSDNGFMSTTEDNDIVYMSDTDESFRNKKDDVTFKVSSALTSDECMTLGTAQKVALSTAVLAADKTGVLSVYDTATATQAKPEQLYVDAYYREWHKPRILLEQCLKSSAASPWMFYGHPALDKTFYVQSLDHNVAEGTCTLTLKEIDND